MYVALPGRSPSAVSHTGTVCKCQTIRSPRLTRTPTSSAAVVAVTLLARKCQRSVQCRGLKKDQQAVLAENPRQLRESEAVQSEAPRQVPKVLSAAPLPAKANGLPAPRTAAPEADMLVRILAVLPYLLPVLDAWRFFGVGISAEVWPSLYTEWMSLVSQPMLQDLLPLLDSAQPFVLFLMPAIAVQRRLAPLLRFNLNQAFVIDLALCILFHCSSLVRWLSLQAGTEIYVPSAAEPPVMPGGRVVLLVVLCLLYCVLQTLAGSFPDGIPAISAEARKSMGSVNRIQMKRERN
ncbi:unnamed protein product [Effrenium voratum]|nr:unnamed protein product [Effrenium voratum]